VKDKIIFWLDANLLYFGIAKALQEKYDCDLFAVIDITDRPKNFFETQQLVRLHKIWYYHDNISRKKSNPDIEYLSLFEKKYGINLWLLACNERLFYNYNRYYRFTKDEILCILEQECKLFENVIDEVKPDFLIMKTTDLHHNHLFYEICKAKQIRILMLGPTRFGYRCMISQEIDKIDNIKESSTENNIKLSPQQLQDYLKGFNSYKQVSQYIKKFQSSRLDLLKALFQHFIISKNTNEKTHYTYYGRTKIRVLITELIYLIKKKYRESFINTNLTREIRPTKPFIYFPLHIEQERVLLIGAPFYTNQLEVITQIIKSLPIGYELYVKEHPDMVTRGWRSVSEYKKIMNLPNIRLIHPSVKPDEIMKSCSFVISIGGTSGLEAAFYGKPSIIFVDMGYSMISSVYKLKTIEELPYAIRSSLQKKLNYAELNHYVNLINQNSFEIDWWNLVLDLQNRLYYGGYLVDVDISMTDLQAFLDDHKSEFDQLALEHIKKIKQYKESYS
jgi:hypothetical protein